MYETFILHTDHNAPQWLLSINELAGHLMRLTLQLSEFGFEINYRLSRASQHTDTFYRLHTYSEPVIHDDDNDILALLVYVTTDQTDSNIVELDLVDYDYYIMNEL